MKNDPITTFLNLVLAAMVMLCALFGGWSMWQVYKQRSTQGTANVLLQRINFATSRAQALLSDTKQYNATAKSPELDQIIKSIENPQAAPTPSAPSK